MKKYTGLLGYVIKPDNKTEKTLKELTNKYSKENDILPKPYHLSLYHGNLKNFPASKANNLLKGLRTLLGNKYVLGPIEPYGGKFLFWNVVKPFNDMQKAHGLILDTITSYVDKEKVGIALKEGLKIPKKHQNNIKKYSYPLVKDLFMPHYALLYRDTGLKNKGTQKHTVLIKEIQFVEIGGCSRINKVFASTK